MEDGRKIKRSHENPIDNVLIDISYFCGKGLIKIPGVTPNMITFLSLFVSLFAVYKISKEKYLIGSILFFFGYFLDCLDGNFARKYDMETTFGDYLDHILDLIKNIALFLTIYFLKNIKPKTKVFFYCCSFVLFLLSFIHLDCQEKNSVAARSNTLNMFDKFCPNKRFINISKYFGTGTSFLILSMLIANLKGIDSTMT